MTKRMLVLALVAAGCTHSHTGAQALAQENCYQCHQPNYEMTPQIHLSIPNVPDHLADETTYPHTCGDCHNTQYWQIHPETAFPLKVGAHKGVLCVECHLDPTDETATGSIKGANTLCTSCHPADEPLAGGGTIQSGHTDQPQTMFDYTKQNFCLSCHPTGVEAPHNETIFPSNHKGAANTCSDCHDRTKGSDQAGQNAPCTRCHRNAHNQSMGDPSGCLAMGCHYGGRGGD